MTWTAEVISVEKTKGPDSQPNELQYDTVIKFTDGVSEKILSFRISDEDALQNTIKNQIAGYEAAATKPPVVGPVEIIRPADPPPPTKDEMDRSVFQQKLMEYQAALNGVHLKILAQGDADALLAELTSLYKAEYLPLLGALRF